MTRLLAFAAAVMLLLAPLEAPAKQRPPRASGSTQKAKKEEKPPPPGDKGTNEGAQGRKNATEDAAREGEPPGSPGRRW
jgi:hypothetical protein